MTTLTIEPAAWRDTLERIAADGAICEWIVGWDCEPGIAVMAMLSTNNGDVARVVTRGVVELASVADLFPSALQHEREIVQMLGVRVTGLPDDKPAFEIPIQGHPLSRDYALNARVTKVWPGASDSDAAQSRQQRVPGIRPGWLAPQ